MSNNLLYGRDWLAECDVHIATFREVEDRTQPEDAEYREAYKVMQEHVLDIVTEFLSIPGNTRCVQPFKVYKFLAEKNKFAPCCDAREIVFDPELYEELGDDYFDKHPRYIERKKNLYNGIRDKDCGACWKKEDRGMRSMRFDQAVESYADLLTLFRPLEEINFEEDVTNVGRFELWMNSTCNLGCFMCNQGNSNTLRKIWDNKHDTGGFVGRGERHYLEDLSTRYGNTNERFHQSIINRIIQRLKDIATDDGDQIMCVAYLGGEPTLHNEMFEHADIFIEAGREAILAGKELKFSMVTNGTSKQKLSERVMVLYRKYQAAGWKTDVMLSQDATDEQVDVRHGADFSAIKRNFVDWLGPDSPIQSVTSFTVVSNLNLPYIDRFAQYMYDSIKEANKTTNTTLNIHFNSIYDPSWMMVHHLPKKYIAEPVARARAIFEKIEEEFGHTGISINYRLFDNLVQQAQDEPDVDEINSVFNAYKYIQETYQKSYPDWDFWETFPHTKLIAEEYNINLEEKANPHVYVRD